MKKLRMHDQSKGERRFIWVDWMLILLALSVVFFGACFFYRRYRAASPTVEVRYQISVKGVDIAFAEDVGGWEQLIPIGATVTSSNGTAELGRVTAIALQPHRVATAKDGKAVFVEHPQKTDLLITVYARGIDGGGDGIRVRDIRVAAGDVWDLRVGGYFATGADIVWVSTEGDV